VTSFTGANKDIPITASREADTTLVLKDGETFAIGGLIRDEDIKILTKVPLLGDLPLIGWLFKNNTTSTAKTELLVFITPRVMNERLNIR